MKLMFLIVISALYLINADSNIDKNMGNYYCEYCGQKFPSVQVLTSGKCTLHPDGWDKGYHKLYEGSEKSKYTCKYCGREYRTIHDMVVNKCLKHPKGSNMGYHSPAS